MTAPETRQPVSDLAAPGYAAYAQLVRMLLPSSGCLAIYGVDGELAWCSDGVERPDFRELVDEFLAAEQPGEPNEGTVRKTSAGVGTLVASLADEAGALLGFVLIELGGAHAGSSMAASLTRPVFACLASQLALERPTGDVRAPAPSPGRRLDFLLGLGEIDLASPSAVRDLLDRCIGHLDCLSAVLCVPDQDLTVLAERAAATDRATRTKLDSTRRHLLAWVQLNNKPMIVNRIDEAQAPYKILSCPVVGREGGTKGLMALFRSAESANFELDDVRLIEVLSRQAMALLHERQDALTGLMSRSAFERHLDETLEAAAAGRSPGMLLYLDVEALKSINDEFGFDVGDEVILRTSQLIRRSLGPGELACRVAGDRFAAHLPERGLDGTETLAAEIVQSARELGYAAAGRRVPLALRTGAAEPVTRRSGGARHWIAAAERACQDARAGDGVPAYNSTATGEKRG